MFSTVSIEEEEEEKEEEKGRASAVVSEFESECKWLREKVPLFFTSKNFCLLLNKLRQQEGCAKDIKNPVPVSLIM